MRQSGWSRMTRPAIWAVVVAFCATLLPGVRDGGNPGDDTVALAAPSSASGPDSEHGRTRISGFNDDRTTVKVGRTVVRQRGRPAEGPTRPSWSRPVKPGSSTFVTQSRGHSAANGTFRAVYVPTSAGTWRFRLRVLRSATTGGGHLRHAGPQGHRRGRSPGGEPSCR